MTYEPVTLDHLLEHQSWALRLARQLVREEHEAEELVQRTWIAALRRPPSTDRGARAWIRQVILNLARERHRRASTRTRHEIASHDPEVSVPDASEALAREEIRARLANRLLALQEPYRTVLTLRYYEDLSSAEIARRLGVPAGTVRWRMKVGLDQLREDLDRESHGDRQRWVSALLPLLPRESAPAGPGAATGPLEHGVPRGVAWFGGFVALAGLSSVVWFLSPRGKADERSVAYADGAETERPLPETEPRPGSTGRFPVQANSTLVPSAEAPASAQQLLVRVRTADGRAVEGARLLVLARGGSDERARTDAHGEARIPLRASDVGALGVPATEARIALLALADGHAASPLWHVAPPFERNAPLELTLGGPAQPLSGRIVDARGAAVGGASVAWYEPQARLEGVVEGDVPGPVTLTTTSAADGRFQLAHLAGPGATLLVQAAGFAPKSMTVHEFSAELEFGLHTGATVEGRVVLADGRPAADVRVATEPMHKASEWAANVPGYDPARRGFPEVTRTDAEGRFRLAHVPPGTRTLWAGDARGAASTNLQLEESGWHEWNPVLGEEHTLRLRLEDEAGAPLAGWQVVLRRPGGGQTWWIRRLASDAEGRIETHECPAGEVFLDVLDRSGLGSTQASRRLSASPEELVLRLETGALATVRGTLLDAAGAPFPDGTLQLVSLRTGMKVETSRELDGRFTLRLAPGAYSAVLRLADGAACLASFELEAGAEHDLGDLQLAAPGTLHILGGALLNGNARTPAYTLYAHFDEQRFLECSQGELDGEAEFRLLPGRYRVLLFDGAGQPPQAHFVTIESFKETRLAP